MDLLIYLPLYLAGILNCQIFAGKMAPPGTTETYCCCFLISHTENNLTGTVNARIQFYIWASDYGTFNEKRILLLTTFQNFSGRLTSGSPMIDMAIVLDAGDDADADSYKDGGNIDIKFTYRR